MTTHSTTNGNVVPSNGYGCARRTTPDPVIAVVGCGLIAERYHLPGLAKNARSIERAIAAVGLTGFEGRAIATL